MTVREDRQVRAPPAQVLAALATAGENEGMTVRDVRAKPPVLIMSTALSIRGASFGFIVTARARRISKGTRLSIDVTPVLGSWALESSQQVLDELIREFQIIMGAPKARIRRPDRKGEGTRPFGRVPELLSALWAGISVVVYGLLVGGLGWIAAVLAVSGAVLSFVPADTPWWDRLVTGCAVLSLPFGVLGAIARRLIRVNHYWTGTVQP